MPRAFIESGATCPYFIVCSCIGRGNISKYKKNRVYPTYSLVDPALFKSDLFEFNFESTAGHESADYSFQLRIIMMRFCGLCTRFHSWCTQFVLTGFFA